MNTIWEMLAMILVELSYEDMLINAIITIGLLLLIPILFLLVMFILCSSIAVKP